MQARRACRKKEIDERIPRPFLKVLFERIPLSDERIRQDTRAYSAYRSSVFRADERIRHVSRAYSACVPSVFGIFPEYLRLKPLPQAPGSGPGGGQGPGTPPKKRNLGPWGRLREGSTPVES